MVRLDEIDESTFQRHFARLSALMEQVAENHRCFWAHAWPAAGFEFVLIKGSSVYAVAHIVIDEGDAPEGAVAIPKGPVEAMRRYRAEHGVEALVFVLYPDKFGLITVDQIVSGKYPEGPIGKSSRDNDSNRDLPWQLNDETEEIPKNKLH